MCVKIVHTKETVEFDPSQPLETQAKGAKQVIVEYASEDDSVRAFMEQLGRIVECGINFQMNLKFNSTHSLEGYKAERTLEALSSELGINELVSKMTEFNSQTDIRLCELAQMCERK